MAAAESFPEGLAGLEGLRVSVPPVAGAFPFGAPVQPFFGAQFPMNSSPMQQGRNSGSSRTGVCASRHMAAEQRRRARINGRLEALRTLVPHSARANTAAFLTEVYNYITSLHKRLENLGHNPLDLNASMAESAGGKKGADNPCTSSMNEGVNPKFQELRSDESDVEFDEMKHNTDDENGKSDGNGSDENGSDASPVLAPSLFDPSNRKLAENKPATSTDTIHSNTSDVFNSVHSSAFTSVNSDLSLSMKPPASPATSNTCHGPEMATSSAPHIISTFVPPSMSASKSRRLREIQPAPMQKSMIQPPAYPFMSISSSSVAAAAAAIAESAAFAQSWGMAAVVAQAQAQVAAQVHAQAQAQVQAMSQAQSQLHTLNSVAHPSSGLSAACPPVYQPVSQPKKRRRGGMSESSPNRSRIAQTVVRPIALKPHP